MRKQQGQQEKKKPTLKEEAQSWAKAGLVAFIIWLFLRSYFVEAFRIPSPSMENTLLVGDFLFVNKMAFGGEFEIPFVGTRFLRVPGYSEAHHDQVVIFRSVEDSTPNLNIVKRIIGEPGDTLQLIRDTVYRNGQLLPEPYALHLAGAPVPDDPFRLQQFRAWQLVHYVGRDPAGYHPTSHDWGPIVVPPGYYFMMGDNRDESYDSRYWGFLPREHVVGRPLFIYMSVATRPFRIRWNRLLRHPS
ncbi:MAG: signal peptidase I [Gemmatimonadetes bacterium]|nr:signal peptidase I [Gemmatimonadota bacterium]